MSGAIIYQWLERIGLGYAIPNFQNAGITTPQQLAAIEMAEGAADKLNIANGKFILFASCIMYIPSYYIYLATNILDGRLFFHFLRFTWMEEFTYIQS